MPDAAGMGHYTPLNGPVRYRPVHVWVDHTGVWSDLKCPGILLEWRRDRLGRWEALVVYVLAEGSHGWDLRHGWVLSDHLRPLSP